MTEDELKILTRNPISMGRCWITEQSNQVELVGKKTAHGKDLAPHSTTKRDVRSTSSTSILHLLKWEERKYDRNPRESYFSDFANRRFEICLASIPAARTDIAKKSNREMN